MRIKGVERSVTSFLQGEKNWLCNRCIARTTGINEHEIRYVTRRLSTHTGITFRRQTSRAVRAVHHVCAFVLSNLQSSDSQQKCAWWLVLVFAVEGT